MTVSGNKPVFTFICCLDRAYAPTCVISTERSEWRNLKKNSGKYNLYNINNPAAKGFATKVFRGF